MNTDKSFFSITELFDVVSGKTQNLKELAPGSTPFISASEKNNGISGYVDDDPTFEGNVITVSRNGSVCEAFYQPNPFCASLDDIRVLQPKTFILNKFIGLYLCAIIKKEKFRYTYGRKFGTERIEKTKIELPATKENKPDWKWIESFMKSSILSKNTTFKSVLEGKFNASPMQGSKIVLNITQWGKFKYGGEKGIFIIKNGYYNKKPDHSEIGSIHFIGSTEYNNGVTEYYSLNEITNSDKDERSMSHAIEQKIFKGNCITVANNGASTGSSFFQEKDFTCSHDVNVLYLREKVLNKYIAMFICTIIKMEKYRWNYGRKWRPSRMPDSEIRLPIDKKGLPDWNFMEAYIKSLSFSSSI